jgi:hypoxia up-regulated 1
MEAEEAAIAAREEQRNILEGYLYKLRDLLESDSQHPFVKHSQEVERRAISRQLKDVSNWFHSQAEGAQTKDFVGKRSSLECVTSIISVSWVHSADRSVQGIRAADRPSHQRDRGVPTSAK